MEIVDCSQSTANRAKVRQLARYDLVIFISRNAVYYGTRLMRQLAVYPIKTDVAAVGIKTAEALAAAGIANALHPRDAASSEALAKTPFIKNMRRGAVLIFRGEGGNPYLGAQLRAQGLEVDYAEVYRRQRPPRQLHLGGDHPTPDLISVASGETLANLHAMTSAASRPILLDTPLVLGSASMRRVYNDLGFRAAPLVARSPIDEDMFAAIMRHCRESFCQPPPC